MNQFRYKPANRRYLLEAERKQTDEGNLEKRTLDEDGKSEKKVPSNLYHLKYSI